MSFFLGMGFWRSQSFYLTIIVISLFIIMTGFQLSAVRAGIMGGSILLAQNMGRLSQSFRILMFVAFILLFVNPLLLIDDVSFQLSFLAVVGIIYLGPVFKRLFNFVPEKSFFNLKSILVMSFSAQIFTLPILIYNFGRISIISPVSNVLALPVIPWIMISGFIFAFLSIFLGSTIGIFLAFPCWILLSYLIKIIDIIPKIPFSYVNFQISWIWLVVLYFLIIFLFYNFRKKIINHLT